MKKMTIPASEVRVFWSILKRFQRRGLVVLSFHNHFAIFTSGGGHRDTISYSAKYEGPKEGGTWGFRPFSSPNKEDGIVIEINEGMPRDSSYRFGSSEKSFWLFPCDKLELPDIQDDGAEVPPDMPKSIKRMMKIRSRTFDWAHNRIYFERILGWNVEGVAAITNGNSAIYTKFPLLHPTLYPNAPLFPMKELPGGGLLSVISQPSSGKHSLCYQSGGWLYICEIESSLGGVGRDVSSLFSPPPAESPRIIFDKQDIKAMLTPFAGWPQHAWRDKVPKYTIKTSGCGIIAEPHLWLGYANDSLRPVVLQKTKWKTASFSREFNINVMEFKNAVSAGFTEYSVEYDAFIHKTVLKSFSKGMSYVNYCTGVAF